MKQKKSSVFVPVITIGFAVLAITGVIWLQVKADLELKPPMGTRQFDLLQKYQRAENMLFYLDTAAKYSMERTAYKLANNSGFYQESLCGRYASYNLWGYYNPVTETYDCFPNNYLGVELLMHLGFWQIFEPLLNSSYLTKYVEEQEGIEPVNLSQIINYEFWDTVLRGEANYTRLAATQIEPPINITLGEDFEYKVAPSFSQVINHNIPANVSYMKDRVSTIHPFLLASSPRLDADTNMVWHHGGCVDDPAERFYTFVELFRDCQERDMTGLPDEWGMQKCTCASYDVRQIPDGYRYVIRQQGGRNRLSLEEMQKIEGVDTWVELWAEWSDPNTLIYGYRYNCGDDSWAAQGRADCDGPTERQCNIDLSSNRLHCGECYDDITPTFYSCVAGREFCVGGAYGASCTECDTQQCWYICGWDCDPYNGCWPVFCEDIIICLHGSCSWSGCPGSGFPCGSLPPKDPYPIYSYDYADEQWEGTAVYITRDSCQDEVWDPIFCQGYNVQFVKIDGNVGFLEKDSEDISVQSPHISKENPLEAWPECGPKKTYRFCVETPETFTVFKEDYDSLKFRTSSDENSMLTEPIRYKFAVKLLP
jgi:hypothetical protein